MVGLRDGLQELGDREDRDFAIGVRFTEGKADDLPAAARDLVRHRVDVIVTTETGTAAKAAQAATSQIPIVFLGSPDPVESGLVQSLARPGGNITGVADLGAELVAKRMEIFRDLVPGLKRVYGPGRAPSWRPPELRHHAVLTSELRRSRASRVTSVSPSA